MRFFLSPSAAGAVFLDVFLAAAGALDAVAGALEAVVEAGALPPVVDAGLGAILNGYSSQQVTLEERVSKS